MAKLFCIGLVAFEIVQGRLDAIAGLLVRADDVDRVAHRFHPLLEDKNLIFLGELAGQHEDLLATHVISLVVNDWVDAGNERASLRVRTGKREVELVGVFRRDQRSSSAQGGGRLKQHADQGTCAFNESFGNMATSYSNGTQPQVVFIGVSKFLKVIEPSTS